MLLRSAAIVLVGVLVARPASADGIVIESYTGPRPSNAGRLLGPVLEELATRGFTVGYDGVGRKYEREVSRAARTPGGMPGDFVSEIERAHKVWINGKFEDAVGILSPLIETAHGNAAAISQDSTLRGAVQRGLIDLALAHQHLGDPAAARSTMGELLRSFPEAVLSRATHGPDAFALYEATRKDLAAGGLGSLVIDVADTGTNVFLDEVYVKAGGVRKKGLYPGTYRVYSTIGQREGRIYTVDVRPDAESRLSIDIAFDAVLHVDPSWIGLAFPSAAEREKLEATYAAQFARLAHASAIAVVGVDTVRGRPALVGALVSLETGRELRRASLTIDPEPSSDRLRALARFLAGDDSARASLDIEDPGQKVRGEPPHRRRWGVLKYITTAAGLAAAGAGAYLLIQDGTCSSDVEPCPMLYNNTTPGWSLAGGGAALLGLGIYMFLTDDAGPERAVTFVPTRGGAIAGVRMTF